MDLTSLLDRLILEWPIFDWLKALGFAAVAALLLVGVRKAASIYFGRLASRTENRLDDVVVALISGARTFFLVLAALAIAATVLGAPESSYIPIWKVFFIALLVQLGLWGNDLITVAGQWYVRKAEEEEGDASRITAARAFGLIARIVLWSFLFILTLDNIGVDITTLVAGLGIGGIAVALAVQNVLQDILAYISILVDKPFVIGDFLNIGEMSGTVEHVGIKSTRLRSLSGEQLVFSNEDLLSSRIRNYKQMVERRIAFRVGVIYGTPAEQLEAIPGMLREAIEAQQDVRFDRAHFKSMDDYSLTFEAVYYVLLPDYPAYMDRQEAINMTVYRRFTDEGIEFAFPTQTLHVETLPGTD